MVFLEKLDAEVGDTVTLDVMMLVDGDERTVGAPVVDGIKAMAKVLAHGKEKKIIVFKYKAKKNVRKKTGHRQSYTRVEIVSIG